MTKERLKELLTKAIDITDGSGIDGYAFWCYLTKDLGLTKEEFAELEGEEYADNMYDCDDEDYDDEDYDDEEE